MLNNDEKIKTIGNIDDYQYLLKLFNLVNEYLSGIKKNEESLSEVIVSFCIVAEKIFKIALYKINPVLVFNNEKLKNESDLISIITNKEENIKTINMSEITSRYKAIFENKLTDDETQVLIDIYNIRNGLVHGYKSDSKIVFDRENIVKKMGTIWEKISMEVISVFGADNIKASKPKKKYTEDELESVLLEEVKKKISRTHGYYKKILLPPNPTASNSISFSDQAIDVANSYNESIVKQFGPAYGGILLPSDICPRCGNYSFSSENYPVDITTVFNFSKKMASLYKCSICNLELTEKEYEIAKKIKNTK